MIGNQSRSGSSRARLRGIFFDLDDTLIGYSKAERTALAAGCSLAARINPKIDERTLAAAIYETYAREFAYGTPGFDDLATLSVRELRLRITGEALRLCGITDAAQIGVMVDTYATAERAALRAFPLTAETLRLLRPHFRLGVITNGPSAMQREKLAALALTGLFEEIVVDTEFGHPKPDTRIFAHAADLVGLAPSELMFIGNSLTADVAGALAAGWTSVWMEEPGTPHPSAEQETPHFVIRSIAETPHLPPVADVMNCHLTFRNTFKQ